jgi:hypothetical protein
MLSMTRDTPICATVEGIVLGRKSKAVREWSKIDIIGHPTKVGVICQSVNPHPVVAPSHGMSSQARSVPAEHGEKPVIVR